MLSDKTVIQDKLDSILKIKDEVIIDSKISEPNKINTYEFISLVEKRIVVETFVRRLNSPLDCYIQIKDERGKVVAENDDFEDASFGLITHHADSRVEFTPEQNKKYFISVMDSQSKGADEYSYRLYIHKLEPDYELRVRPFAISSVVSSSVKIGVHILRRDGFDGEVDLSISGLEDGAFASGAKMEKGKDIADISITLPQKLNLDFMS